MPLIAVDIKTTTVTPINIPSIVADEKVIWQAPASGVATGPQELSSGAVRAVNAMLDRFPDRRH